VVDRSVRYGDCAAEVGLEGGSPVYGNKPAWIEDESDDRIHVLVPKIGPLIP
jgi:hypothetical protein